MTKCSGLPVGEEWDFKAVSVRSYGIIPDGSVGQRICLPMQEMQVRSLVQEDPLKKGMATHSRVLDWRIPLACYSPWGHKELDTSEHTYARVQSWTPKHTLCNCSLGKELDMRSLLPSQNYMGYSNSWFPSWILLEKHDLLERISEQCIFIFYSKIFSFSFSFSIQKFLFKNSKNFRKKLIIIANHPQVVNY